MPSAQYMKILRWIEWPWRVSFAFLCEWLVINLSEQSVSPNDVLNNVSYINHNCCSIYFYDVAVCTTHHHGYTDNSTRRSSHDSFIDGSTDYTIKLVHIASCIRILHYLNHWNLHVSVDFTMYERLLVGDCLHFWRLFLRCWEWRIK